MLARTGPARPRRPDVVKTTMGRQVRVGNRVSRPGLVSAPAAMAANSAYPPPEVGSLQAARAPIRALAAPTLITPGLAVISSAAGPLIAWAVA